MAREEWKERGMLRKNKKGLRWRKVACGGWGMRNKAVGEGGGRIICFSPSALLYDTRKSDSYHNGRMNHFRN